MIEMYETETFYEEIETEEDCMCSACHEHASIIKYYTNGVLEEQVSNCCGAKVYDY